MNVAQKGNLKYRNQNCHILAAFPISSGKSELCMATYVIDYPDLIIQQRRTEWHATPYHYNLKNLPKAFNGHCYVIQLIEWNLWKTQMFGPPAFRRIDDHRNRGDE
ncbi:hypothetical protein M378DRAFT_456227 [Amanita muscaria Koide BX008]|uniref:Uncharacterized protein n=1 Tax=Amanita muscaria (strain Koide BX008) TaxID=946122 RepID=A0A0C2WV87_AMAMK|nr:hypothetical protein M378DRAFT_456227 [Amanita muscaria Koide BX008]